MKSLILSIADQAYMDNITGKLYITGAFNRIHLRPGTNFPIRHQSMTLVIKLASEFTDRLGEHAISITLLDGDDKELLRVDQTFVIKRHQGGLPSESNFLLEIRDIVFHKSGEYQFSIDIDDEFFDSTVLVVTDAPVPQG